MGTLAAVDIVCPTCGRDVSIPVTMHGPEADADKRCIAVLRPDWATIHAHVLTHTRHDGEPLATAA